MQITQTDSKLTIAGDITAATVAEVVAALKTYPEKLELTEADIADGFAMAAVTAALKRLLQKGYVLTLEGPPQLLVHNLYRVGYYPYAGLQVVGLRQDEPYG